MAAIYQWFVPSEPDGYLNYEFVLLATDLDWKARYIGIDYDAGIFTDFAAIPTPGNVSLVCPNGTDIFSDINLLNLDQFIWRGNAFTKIAQEPYSTTNSAKQLINVSGIGEQLVTIGANAFGDGMSVVPYNPIDLGLEYNPANDGWTGGYDLKIDVNEERGYGNGLICIPAPGNAITTYEAVNGVLTFRHSLVTSGLIAYHDWGINHQTGQVAARHHVDNNIDFYQVDMTTLVTSYVTTWEATDYVNGVGFSNNGFVLTAERDVGNNDWLRVYNTSGVLQDQYALFRNNNTSVTFQNSRISGRIWLLGTFESHVYIFNVDDAGQISIEFELPTLTVGSSGGLGSPIAFLEAPLNISPNGFTGIKEKLFNAWEFNEIGSVTRTSALPTLFNNTDFIVAAGTVLDTPGVVGNAADFDGASALTLNDIPAEIRIISSFSLCCNVTLNSKATTQRYLTRGSQSWIGPSFESQDFGIEYDQGADRFTWFVYIDGTKYAVQAGGSPVLGQDYHLYVEYDKVADTISFAVDDGILATLGLPAGSAINLYSEPTQAAVSLGRATSQAANADYLTGTFSQLFWFWDTLTADEITWMRNNGNSRAFSEL